MQIFLYLKTLDRFQIKHSERIWNGPI